MYDEFSLDRKTYYAQEKTWWKNVQNLKNNVKGILWFCNKIPNNKPEDPTEILTYKVSLPLMANYKIDQLRTRSIEKGLMKNKMGLTMTLLRDTIVEKNIRWITIIIRWLRKRRVHEYLDLNVKTKRKIQMHTYTLI